MHAFVRPVDDAFAIKLFTLGIAPESRSDRVRCDLDILKGSAAVQVCVHLVTVDCLCFLLTRPKVLLHVAICQSIGA